MHTLRIELRSPAWQAIVSQMSRTPETARICQTLALVGVTETRIVQERNILYEGVGIDESVSQRFCLGKVELLDCQRLDRHIDMTDPRPSTNLIF